MSETEKQPVMKADGFYDRHSSLQKVLLGPMLRMISRSAKELPAQKPLTIVDYGVSEGANSVFVIDHALREIWKRDAEQVVSVIHEDQYRNNFNRLFQNIYESENETYTPAVLNREHSGKLFTFASGRSFYEQIAPDGSVDLGVTSSAAHWLPALPAIKNHLMHFGADENELPGLIVAAADAWEKFLSMRARELIPGGRLLVAMGGSLTASMVGTEIPETFDLKQELPVPAGLCTVEPLMNLMHSEIESLISEKKIERSQYDNFILPIYARTYNELMAPFQDKNSACYDSFEVEHMWVQTALDPMLANYQESGDASRYATELVSTVQAFTEPILVSGLFAADDEQRVDVISKLFERMLVKIRDTPDKYTFNAINSYAMLKRTDFPAKS